MWFVIIHLTFVVSAVMMGVLDRITSSQHRGHKGEGEPRPRHFAGSGFSRHFCSGSVPVRIELHRHRVQAIALAGRPRAVVEDVAEMAVAAPQRISVRIMPWLSSTSSAM